MVVVSALLVTCIQLFVCLNTVTLFSACLLQGVPSFWTDQKGSKCLFVALQSGDQEYQQVEQRFKATNLHQVVKIERVQNPELYHKYAARKENMKTSRTRENGVTEMLLYYGNDGHTISSICKRGINEAENGMQTLNWIIMPLCTTDQTMVNGQDAMTNVDITFLKLILAFIAF